MAAPDQVVSKTDCHPQPSSTHGSVVNTTLPLRDANIA